MGILQPILPHGQPHIGRWGCPRVWGHLRKTWWDWVEDMRSLGLSQEEAQSGNKRWRKIMGDQLTQVQLEKLLFKQCAAPCGLRGCKNWPAPFPGRMSYKATKPGLVSVLCLSIHYMVLLFIRAPFHVLLVFIAMYAVFWLFWLSYQYLPSDWLERLVCAPILLCWAVESSPLQFLALA